MAISIALDPGYESVDEGRLKQVRQDALLHEDPPDEVCMLSCSQIPTLDSTEPNPVDYSVGCLQAVEERFGGRRLAQRLRREENPSSPAIEPCIDCLPATFQRREVVSGFLPQIPAFGAVLELGIKDEDSAVAQWGTTDRACQEGDEAVVVPFVLRERRLHFPCQNALHGARFLHDHVDVVEPTVVVELSQLEVTVELPPDVGHEAALRPPSDGEAQAQQIRRSIEDGHQIILALILSRQVGHLPQDRPVSSELSLFEPEDHAVGTPVGVKCLAQDRPRRTCLKAGGGRTHQFRAHFSGSCPGFV